MNKSELMLAARAKDLAASAAKREYDFVCSRFLSPAEQAVYFNALRQSDPSVAARAFFYGGAAMADRRVCIAVPSYIDLSEVPSALGHGALFSAERERAFAEAVEAYAPGESFGITPLQISGSGFASLSHRDYMGSILALGIEREVVGDIAVTGDSAAVIFVCDVIAPFISESLTRIGRDTVEVARADLPRDFVIPRRFEGLTVIAASDRADAVVGALTGKSRSEAKELCLSGFVDICYVTCDAPDATVSPGDTVSVRGAGKFIIDSFDGETRSGRMRISVRKYL